MSKPHRAISEALLAWYRRSRRALPWRETRDPYAIWVSEVMLQQTQVATVLGYYERWMQRFPSVAALANASEPDVLHAWQGLGYYSRARNLLRGAQKVQSEYGGRIPDNLEALLELPGVGRYSAGAIGSIAYGMSLPIVDGNVTRVLCRLFALRGDPSRAPLKEQLWSLAHALIPDGSAGDFNQALMELGATTCTPREPACQRCPVAQSCAAARDGLVRSLPETPKRPTVTPVNMVAAVVWKKGRVLVTRVREDAARWAGMWQFPNGEAGPSEAHDVALARSVRELTGLGIEIETRLMSIRHTVTRYRITLDAYRCRLAPERPRRLPPTQASWRLPAELDALAMPAAHRRLARRVQATP